MQVLKTVITDNTINVDKPRSKTTYSVAFQVDAHDLVKSVEWLTALGLEPDFISKDD